MSKRQRTEVSAFIPYSCDKNTCLKILNRFRSVTILAISSLFQKLVLSIQKIRQSTTIIPPHQTLHYLIDIVNMDKFSVESLKLFAFKLKKLEEKVFRV